MFYHQIKDNLDIMWDENAGERPRMNVATEIIESQSIVALNLDLYGEIPCEKKISCIYKGETVLPSEREDILSITWGELADYYGVECPGDRDMPLTVYRDEDGVHITDLNDDDWCPGASQIEELGGKVS